MLLEVLRKLTNAICPTLTGARHCALRSRPAASRSEVETPCIVTHSKTTSPSAGPPPPLQKSGQPGLGNQSSFDIRDARRNHNHVDVLRQYRRMHLNKECPATDR